MPRPTQLADYTITHKWDANNEQYTPPHHNRFAAPFLGPPGWAGSRRELLDFMVQGEINRGRHADHPAGHHSI